VHAEAKASGRSSTPTAAHGITLQHLALCAGETAIDKLWVPQNSRAKSEQSIVEGQFGESPRYAVLLWHQSTDVLAPSVLAALLKFEADVDAISVGTDTYAQLCKKAFSMPGAPCVHRTVLDFWHRNETLLKRGFRHGIHSFVNTNATSAAGIPIKESSVLGEVVRDADGVVLKAKTLKSSWLLSPGSTTISAVKDWELQFEALAAKFRIDELGGADLVFVTTDSLERELELAGKDNIKLGAAGTILILLFLMSLMVNTQDSVKSSAGLAIGGLICILLSMLAGVGLALHLGVLFTPITLIILFLVLGVGVDDMLLMMACFDATDVELPLVERNAEAMGTAGVFVTVSTMTTVLAFLAGSASIFPAITHFVVSAALVMFVNYVNAVTIFNSLMILNFRRIEQGRLDGLCCCKFKQKTDRNDSEKHGFLDHLQRNRKADPTISAVIEAFVVPSLFSTPKHTSTKQGKLTSFSKVLLVVLPIIAAMFARFFLVNCKEGMDTKLVVVDDGGFDQYLDLVVQHFSHLGEHLQVCLYKGQQNELDASTFAVFESTVQQISELSVVEASATVSFWAAFTQHGSAVSPSLVSDLSNFKTSVAPQYSQDITGSSGTSIDAVRVHMYHQYLATSDIRLQAMIDVRAIVDKANAQLPDGHRIYAFAKAYVLWDSYALIRTEALTSILISGLVVFCVLLVFLHPSVAVQVVFVVVCIDGFMLGWIPMLGMQLHSVTTICIIMSVGVAVDFSAHIAHAFLDAKGTNIERSARSIKQLMPSLCLGGLTTFLGTLPLSQARVESSRIFFKMMVGVLLAGIVFGSIYLPALMALVGPKQAAVREGTIPGNKVEPQKPKKLSKQKPTFASVATVANATANFAGSGRILVRENSVKLKLTKNTASLPYENLVFSGGGVKCSVLQYLFLLFLLLITDRCLVIGIHGRPESAERERLSTGVQTIRRFQRRIHDCVHVCPQF
jgi:predicted RND superfamily exporter protein